MNIKDITKNVSGLKISGPLEQEVTGIAYSSQKVKPGFLFAALKGEKSDGLDFVPEALEKGASAVLCRKEKPEGFSKVWIQAQDARLALALISAEYYGQPSKKLTLIGITGTKGKTTATYALEQMLIQAGFSPGVIGSISYRGPQFNSSAQRTTPEAPDTDALLQKMLEQGATHCVMEVSSHSIELKRINGIDFDVTAFTNLSGEHLDFHKTLGSYFQAKKKLFITAKSSRPVINTDSEWGQKLASELPQKCLTFGILTQADVFASHYKFSPDGLTAHIRSPSGAMDLTSPLLGKPNLYNILTAASCALALNIPLPAIQKGAASLEGVPGRFERVANDLGLHVFVDYAHTDEALKNLLETAREIHAQRIILVFGAGGDRDQSKRPRMGEVAGTLADWTIITSDNPRSEDPLDIIADIEKGIKKSGSAQYEIEPDRKKAIQKALSSAQCGDTVLIAGKGHEKYQVIKDRIIPFDDVDAAKEAEKEIRTH
ncbi:MAG: UDP-N-acetylmuramoyl-L-alanyl-D-glutamate--2,6-diaminopimelate ligase [Candidatus Aminicenantes bacterium]|nr:UDP-N-acetylmuramoyl-L-alanyl-D-glutamate--2,6-diaminopimelate ligase [Candidatus Aminicenantes bacterium]